MISAGVVAAAVDRYGVSEVVLEGDFESLLGRVQGIAARNTQSSNYEQGQKRGARP